MAFNLRKELRNFGWNGDPDNFKRAIYDARMEYYSYWSEDELLVNPKEGQILCKVVRDKCNTNCISDSLILRTMLNMRKQKWSKDANE